MRWILPGVDPARSETAGRLARELGLPPLLACLLARRGIQGPEAAERFLIPLSTLNQKIKRLGIDVRRRGRIDESQVASLGK